jgi:hypothetical protein
VASGLLADLVVLVHAAFVVFVVAGGLLVLRWPRVAWAHVPAAAWGALIEFAGWICPLTPLELSLRVRAGEQGYRGDFVEHHVLPILYPDWLTRPTQFALGMVVLIINVAVYAAVFWRARRRRQ